MKFSLRSAAPDSACSPMSNVPPSPAQATTVTSCWPLRSNAARRPEAVAAAVSKAVWNSGTFTAELVKGPAMIDQQQAGSTTIVRCPRALSASFIPKLAPQPEQAKWPGCMYSASGIEKFFIGPSSGMDLLLLRLRRFQPDPVDVLLRSIQLLCHVDDLAERLRRDVAPAQAGHKAKHLGRAGNAVERGFQLR